MCGPADHGGYVDTDSEPLSQKQQSKIELDHAKQVLRGYKRDSKQASRDWSRTIRDQEKQVARLQKQYASL